MGAAPARESAWGTLGVGQGTGLCYQGGRCPGEAWGLGGSSAAQARVGKGPRCTPYAVPVPASSARSGRPIPHLSRSGAVPSVGGSCFVAGAGRRRRFVALRPRARV